MFIIIIITISIFISDNLNWFIIALFYLSGLTQVSVMSWWTIISLPSQNISPVTEAWIYHFISLFCHLLNICTVIWINMFSFFIKCVLLSISLLLHSSFICWISMSYDRVFMFKYHFFLYHGYVRYIIYLICSILSFNSSFMFCWLFFIFICYIFIFSETIQFLSSFHYPFAEYQCSCFIAVQCLG